MAQDILHFPAPLRAQLDAYLRPRYAPDWIEKPHVTLTYAASLDSNIAAIAGVQTVLSGKASKSMTHYLRTRHDAILVGSGTAIADDPTLNSRISDAALHLQPQPVIVDGNMRWDVNATSRVIQAARWRRGKPPWVLVRPDRLIKAPKTRIAAVEDVGGCFKECDTSSWRNVLALLAVNGIASVMVEGGATVINDILANHQDTVDSVIVTIAPVYLGQGGVNISPQPPKNSLYSAADPVARLTNVKWMPLEQDVVMCGKLQAERLVSILDA